MKKNTDLIKTLLIVGSGGAFLLSALFAVVVFDKVNPNSTAPIQEIELGMAVQATDQHIDVFVDAAILMHIGVEILDIQKTDEHFGNAAPGSIIDLFPVGAPAYGKGSIEFRIKSVSKDMFPNIANRSGNPMAEMAFIKQATFNEFVKSVLKLAAVGIKSVGLITWMMALLSIVCIAAGAGMLYLDKAKTPVEALDDD